MGGFKEFVGKLGGRKFLLAILGVVIVVFQERFGISAAAVEQVGYVVISFIVGQGFADGISKGATSTTTPE